MWIHTASTVIPKMNAICELNMCLKFQDIKFQTDVLHLKYLLGKDF